jgi:hypothetical protein
VSALCPLLLRVLPAREAGQGRGAPQEERARRDAEERAERLDRGVPPHAASPATAERLSPALPPVAP